MKRLAPRFAAAFITAAAGVTAAVILPSRLAPATPEPGGGVARLQPAGQPVPARAPAPPESSPNPLEAVYVTSPKWSHAGYDIERSYDDATGESTATISRGGKVLATHENGGMGEDSTQTGLFPFLGGGDRQLVVMQYTGGAHCCWIYHVYELSPRLRLIFDGDAYTDNIGYELHPEDLDGDGRFEFTQSVMTFDYFHMSHAASVFPVAVFSYDEAAASYLPANHKFPEYVLRGLEKDLKRVAEERAKVVPNSEWLNEGYLSAVLQVTLKYVYAGREAEGLEFYEREYNLSNKDEVKGDLKKALAGDPVYRAIYRGARAGGAPKGGARP